MGKEFTEAEGTPDGIYLCGVVIGRSRKQMENGYRYMYAIDTGSGIVKASVWGEHEFFPLHTHIAAPIEIKPYLTARNRPMYMINIPNGPLGVVRKTFKTEAASAC